MATFNSMQQPTDAIVMNHHGGHHMGIDPFDPDALHFDEALLDNSALPPLPYTPTYDFNDFATFEDPFQHTSRHYEPAPAHQDALIEESSPQELDNKLLGFSETISIVSLMDDSHKFAEVNMSAELYGMFFVAEDVFGGENGGRPLELTCYRRNLWQCSGQIILPNAISGIVDEQGHRISITDLSASITAVESIEGKPTEIISIPWKNANPQGTEDTKIATAPPDISLDLSSGQEVDANRVSLTVSWKRLQFKHATANNGRRKGLQQHYVVQINLMGKIKSGEAIKIAEIQSSPVIVRGRSPRNFDSRKDVPLTSETSKRLERKNTAGSDNAHLKAERENLQAQVQRFQSMGVQQGPEWSIPTPHPVNHSPHPNKRMAISPTVTKPLIPGWSRDIGGNVTHHGAAPRAGPSVPINLSLSEDERSPNRSSVEVQSPQIGRHTSTGTHNVPKSPSEEGDPLYEYFPLSVDDWMPPVDAVYRPHVVHHTIVPPEFKAHASQNKAKRYFAAE